MNDKGTFAILESYNLILESYLGEITMDDIFYLKKIISENNIYNPTYDVIHDFREASFKITNKDLYKVKDFLKSHPNLSVKRSGVYLASKPNVVAISTLISIFLEYSPIETKTFTTIKAAMSWLKNDLCSIDLIEEKLKDLKVELPIL